MAIATSGEEVFITVHKVFLMVKELCTSVYICQSYDETSSVRGVSGVRTKSTLRGQGELEAQTAEPGWGSWKGW